MIVHLLFNPFENDSRVLKETTSIANSFGSQKIVILARGSEVKPHYEEVFENLVVYRFFTWSENHINLSFFKGLLLTIEWSLYCLKFFFFSNPKILHCHDLNTLHIGFVAKLVRPKTRIIYDAHELETEQVPGNSFRKRMSKIWERILVSRIDGFITVNESIRENYEYLYGIKNGIVLFNSPNKVNIEERSTELRDRLQLSTEDTLYIYQGGVSEGRGIEIILDAFSKLPKNFHIVFMGSGPLVDMIKDYSARFLNIHHVPPVSYAQLAYITSGADVGLLLYENTCRNNYLCSPNKLFEYINSEIPFICSPLFELSRIVKKFRVGTILKRNDSESLMQAIQSCKKNDQSYDSFFRLKDLFSWEVQEQKLIELYQRILTQ